MAQTIFYLILIIIVFDFVFEQWLDYLNTTRWSEKLPDELKGIYNEEEYARSQAYKKANRKFGMLTSAFSFILILAMLLFDGFAIVDSWASSITSHYILVPLVFFGIIGIVSDILTQLASMYL
ncbi:MAG: hypothetical protein K9G70_02550 [Prolixibacteraceae bacterium]|nr:hypothetical protein [Prolixibacteraceae bacterium]